MSADPIPDLCGDAAEACRCVELPDHEGAHRCDCLGSWMWDNLGRLVPVTFPGGGEVSLVGMFEELDRMLERLSR